MGAGKMDFNPLRVRNWHQVFGLFSHFPPHYVFLLAIMPVTCDVRGLVGGFAFTNQEKLREASNSQMTCMSKKTRNSRWEFRWEGEL
jgi:hypothetical protein